MRRGPEAGVAAVVLASRGGTRLARALASVAWAGERVVLDAGAQLAGETLPAGVVRHAGVVEPGTLVRSPWLLLLAEDETVSAALADAVGAATADPSAAAGHRIEQETIGFGVCLRLRGAPIRLARRADARLVLGTDLAPALAVPGRPGRLSPPLVVHGGDRLAEVMADLDADAATLAALLAARGVRCSRRHLLVAPLAAGTRVLTARRILAAAWGRWFLAVLAGYRTVVAYAKLWEHDRMAGSVPA